MSFAEEAARQLVNNHTKFAQEFADDSEDTEADPGEKRNTLLKALAILGLGGAAAYGAWELKDPAAKWLAAKGSDIDKKVQSPPAPPDPHAATTQLGDAFRKGKDSVEASIPYGATAGVAGGLAANSRSPAVKWLRGLMGMTDSPESAAATRIEKLLAGNKPPKDGKKGDKGEPAKAPEEPGLIRKTLDTLNPFSKARIDIDKGHLGAFDNIRKAFAAAHPSATPEAIDAHIRQLVGTLRGGSERNAVTNPVMAGKPNAPATWTGKNVAGLEAEALEKGRAMSSGPLKNIQQVAPNSANLAIAQAKANAELSAHRRALLQARKAVAANPTPANQAAVANLTSDLPLKVQATLQPTLEATAPNLVARGVFNASLPTGGVSEQNVRLGKALNEIQPHLSAMAKTYPRAHGRLGQALETTHGAIKPTVRIGGAAGAFSAANEAIGEDGIARPFYDWALGSQPTEQPQAQ